MAENSKIEWTDHTANLWWGCAKVHAGCKNCYAEKLSNRFGDEVWGENTPRKRILSFYKDLNKYQTQAKKRGVFSKIFVGSMMDIFEDNKRLNNLIEHGAEDTNTLRHELFMRINYNWYPNLIFLFLTKRPENIIHLIPYQWINNTPKNVWYGTSVSNMETWKYAESLKLVSNTNLFLSIEPQIGQINNVDLTGINWVIQGGESGPNYRKFDIEWAYQMKELCKNQNIPYFFKQIHKLKNEIPKNLMIRQFPKELNNPQHK